MSYEVELKFAVANLPAFAKRLIDLDIPIAPVEEETDVYFAHPARDFAVTDEALRLRQKGAEGYITYKGPKIDPTTKTRRGESGAAAPIGALSGAPAMLGSANGSRTTNSLPASEAGSKTPESDVASSSSPTSSLLSPSRSPAARATWARARSKSGRSSR